MTDPTDPSAAPEDTGTPTGLLHLRTWLPAELHEPFSAWCDTHHLEQLAVPGFRRVRRFSLVRSAVDDPPRYLTIYDLDRLEVLDGDDYAAYRGRSSGLPDFLRPTLRAARSDARLVERVPPGAGVVPTGEALLHLYAPVSAGDGGGPDPADWFTANAGTLLDTTGGTTARLFRTSAGEHLVLVELPTLADAPELSTVPQPEPEAAGWGLYHLDFTAGAEGTAPVRAARPDS